MRTTLTIDDDIYAYARNAAERKKISIGAAISELARRALNRTYGETETESVPVFSVSEKAPLFGLEEVKKDEDE